MPKIKIGVAGYCAIGQKLADSVAEQEYLELVGIADLIPTMAIRSLQKNNMIGNNGVKYDLYLMLGADDAAFQHLGIPVAGTFEELCSKVDIMLDTPSGLGRKFKIIYEKLGVPVIFYNGTD